VVEIKGVLGGIIKYKKDVFWDEKLYE